MELPVELISGILMSLPEKSILRFKSVSKEWNCIINQPSFVRFHDLKLNQLVSKENGRYLFLCTQGYERQTYSLVYDENSNIVANYKEPVLVKELSKLVKGTGFEKDCVYPLCSCDGLFLIECGGLQGPNGYKQPGFFIWNPFIRDLMRIELTTPTGWGTWGIGYAHRTSDCKVLTTRIGWGMWGIGYDHRTSDYKVLRVNSSGNEVYSLKTKSWSSICGGKSPYSISSFDATPVSMNSHPHWLARRSDSGEPLMIAYFNAAMQDIGELLLPPVRLESEDTVLERSLQVLNGCLCFAISDPITRTLSIWSMKEYVGQILRHPILAKNLRECSPHTPVHISRSGRVLLFLNGGKLTLYDVKLDIYHSPPFQGEDFSLGGLGDPLPSKFSLTNKSKLVPSSYLASTCTPTSYNLQASVLSWLYELYIII